MNPWRAALTSATASGNSTRIASRSAIVCSSAPPRNLHLGQRRRGQLDGGVERQRRELLALRFLHRLRLLLRELAQTAQEILGIATERKSELHLPYVQGSGTVLCCAGRTCAAERLLATPLRKVPDSRVRRPSRTRGRRDRPRTATRARRAPARAPRRHPQSSRYAGVATRGARRSCASSASAASSASSIPSAAARPCAPARVATGARRGRRRRPALLRARTSRRSTLRRARPRVAPRPRPVVEDRPASRPPRRRARRDTAAAARRLGREHPRHLAVRAGERGYPIQILGERHRVKRVDREASLCAARAAVRTAGVGSSRSGRTRAGAGSSSRRRRRPVRHGARRRDRHRRRRPRARAPEGLLRRRHRSERGDARRGTADGRPRRRSEEGAARGG